MNMFQSAPPVKGATVAFHAGLREDEVSIRAPREGGDSRCTFGLVLLQVSIRAPREGGDRIVHLGRAPINCFNPRPP